MTEDTIIYPQHDHSAPRRDFLRKSILAALPLAGFALPATAAITMSTPLPAVPLAAFNPPSRVRGNAMRNVRDYGADGNGSTDDTAAFQGAINSLPGDGGTVYVPAGNYLIDVVRSVQLRSNMHLEMHPDAKLAAKPSRTGVYGVLLVEGVHDVEISGGQIIGERDRHLDDGGEEGREGTHGIRVRGAQRVTIRDIQSSKNWGDGISVGPKLVYQSPCILSRDVVIVGAVCTHNRRNALTIANAVGVKVYDSEFSDTYGTKPQCGIDVEPSETPHGNNYCDQVHIENCIIARNAKNGLNLWSSRVRGATIKNCVMEANGVCGLFAEAAQNVVLTGNTIARNQSTGAAIRKNNKNFQVSGNTFYNNYAKQGPNSHPPFYLVGVNNSVRKDIMVSSEGTSGMDIRRNYYR